MKIHIKQCIVINLPTEDIFAYMSDFENLLDWSSVITSIQATSSGAVGATAKSTVRFLGKWSKMTLEVVEYEPGRSLVFKSTSGVAPCLFSFQFEQLENGGTSIAQDTVISLIEGLRDLSEQVITNAMCRILKHDLLTLKDILETSASTRCNVVRA